MKAYKALDEFKIGKHNICWVDSDFKRYFSDTIFTKEKRKLDSHLLPRDMTDEEIIKEFNIKECTLGDILNAMDNNERMSKNSYVNLFYTSSCVVVVFWSAVGHLWFVSAWGRGGYRWHAGDQVFSLATCPLVPRTICPLKMMLL